MTETPADIPGAVARQFLRALDEERWEDAVDLVDPAAVQAHFDWWRSRIGKGGRSRITIETAVRPPAGHHAAGEVRILTPPAFLPGSAGATGIESVAELDALTPAEAMVRATLHMRNAVAETRANAAHHGFPAGEPDVTSEPRRLNVVVGDVQEMDDLAHVVYRRLLQHGERTHLIEPVNLMSMRRTASGWRVMEPEQFDLGHPGFRFRSRPLTRQGGWHRTRRV